MLEEGSLCVHHAAEQMHYLRGWVHECAPQGSYCCSRLILWLWWHRLHTSMILALKITYYRLNLEEFQELNWGGSSHRTPLTPLSLLYENPGVYTSGACNHKPCPRAAWSYDWDSHCVGKWESNKSQSQIETWIISLHNTHVHAHAQSGWVGLDLLINLNTLALIAFMYMYMHADIISHGHMKTRLATTASFLSCELFCEISLLHEA